MYIKLWRYKKKLQKKLVLKHFYKKKHTKKKVFKNRGYLLIRADNDEIER